MEIAGRNGNFTGEVQVEMLRIPAGPDRPSAGSVTFSRGARTVWHSHPLGQTLIATAGVERILRWSDPVEELRRGDVVHIPLLVKHWHGAAPDRPMTHLALTEVQDGQSAT